MANATSSDDAPTSGFQLSEISRKFGVFSQCVRHSLILFDILCYFVGATKSSYQANTQIQQYLVDRLSKPNHNIKFKALMIIKVIQYNANKTLLV